MRRSLLGPGSPQYPLRCEVSFLYFTDRRHVEPACLVPGTEPAHLNVNPIPGHGIPGLCGQLNAHVWCVAFSTDVLALHDVAMFCWCLRPCLEVQMRNQSTNATSKPGNLAYGRGLHSSTSQLNLSCFWSQKPQQASTSQLNLGRFCRCDL
jgi:hypothetical protein